MSALFGILHLFAILSVQCWGQPILPSLSYPVFIFTPPDLQKTQSAQQITYQPIQTVGDHSVTAPPEPGYEVSQFHSQDELGRVVFGFHGPDQSRMESRALDGSIRGTYSYVDPNGHVVKMQYWDDGTGFHVTGNSLPNGQPAYTPEVAAARAAHLKVYQAALQAAHNIAPSIISDGSNDGINVDMGSSDGHGHFDVNLPQFDKDNGQNSLFGDDESDSVALDNPELFDNYNYQEEEKKDEEKQGVSEVEGEVDLGEDVGPDEDEEEEDQNGDEEYDGEHYFRKKYNRKQVGPIKSLQNPLFRVSTNKANDNSKNPAISVKNENQNDNGSKENDRNNDDEYEDGGNEDNENHKEHEKNEGDETHESNENQEDNEPHNENDNQEESGTPDANENHEDSESLNADENHEDESDADEHFDTVEHLFTAPDVDAEHFKDTGFIDRQDEVKDQESFDGVNTEQSDAETAENQKSIASHALLVPQTSVNNKIRMNSEGLKERIDDQIFYQTNLRSQVPRISPSKGFVYFFQHTIPKPIERVDLNEERAVDLSNSQNLRVISLSSIPTCATTINNNGTSSTSPAIAKFFSTISSCS